MTRLRRLALSALVVGLALASAAACGRSGDDAGLPDVSLDSATGGDPVDLGALDRPTVVNLWATWCAPCRAELPAFEAVHLDLGDQVAFLGVNVGEPADTARGLIDELGLTFDQVLDPESRLNAELEIVQMPSTILVDASGDVVDIHTGALTEADLRVLVDETYGVS